MQLLYVGLAIPELLVVLLGLVLSLAFRKRLGSRATSVVLGFVAMTVSELVSLFASVFSANAPWFMSNMGMSYGVLGIFFSVSSILRMLFALAGWALLLVALFRRTSDRPGAATAPGAPYGQRPGQFPGGSMPGGPMPGGPGSAPMPGQHPWDQPAWGQPAPGQPQAGPQFGN
ncbi:MAG: hypothetical protein WCA46_19110, partial [Actinocatenispora sp.]